MFVGWGGVNENHCVVSQRVCKCFLCAQLWTALMPGEQLEARVTKQWGDIGFQGKDPATDFRGMGTMENG